MKNYEATLETITPEQWEAIAAFATEKARGTATATVETSAPAPETEKELYARVTELLQKLGAKPHIKGYRYLREAVILVYNRWDYVEAVTKALYPDIAKKFDTTASRAERAIRHSVEVMYDYGNIEVLSDVFTNSPERGRPTNSEAIACIVEYLKNR